MQSTPREGSENNFLVLLNFIVDPAVIVDEKGRILLVNNALEDSTGLSAKEVIGKVFLELSILPAESKAIILENLEMRMQGLPVQPYEITFTNKNGELTYTEIKAKKISYAGQPADLVIFRDITRRKKNLAKLEEYSEKMEALVNEKAREIKENKEKLEKIFNSSPDAITVVDLNGNIIECNEATLHLLGFSSRDDLIGKDNLEMVSPKERKKASLLMEELFRNGSVKNAEITFLTKEGKEFPAESSASIITDATGNPVGFVTVTRDIIERKRARKTLQESEERYRELTQSISDVFFAIDKDLRYTYWNKASEKLTGILAKDAIGKSLTEVFPGAKGTKVEQFYQEALKGKQSKSFLNKYKIGDEDFVFEIIAYPTMAGLSVFVKDITERKKMEEVLRESEEKYRKQFEEALDAIFVADCETGILVDCNRAASELVGREKSELVGMNQRILHPSREIEGDLSRTFKKHIKEKEGEILEAQVITKRGEIKDVAIKANVFEVRGKKMLQGSFRDITERKKMEVEVKQKLDMLEALTENLGVGFAIISKDYHVLWANKFMKNNVGEVEGKQCYSSLNTLDHICPDCGVKKVFEEGVAKDSHEYTNIGIHGKPYYVELIATPLKDKDGNVTAALEFVVDIAEKKRMQNELTEYSQKLEKLVNERTEELEQTQTKLLKAEKLAAIGELAAMIGHDLRNPLTGIKGAAYYLKTKCAAEIGATGKEMLKTIDKAIDHSNKIINDLLEYSCKLRLDLTETTPKSLLKTTLTLIKIPERTQIIDATKNKPKIKADIGNISKVFANIITNAIDAIPGTGTLTITSKTAKGNVKIIFKDTGIGMTEETLRRLKLGFPLFTTKAKGMGFGLPICKRIVEAHDGKISLKSTLGKGTTVIVTIPVNPKTVDEGEEKWIFNESMLQEMRTSQKIPRKP